MIRIRVLPWVLLVVVALVVGIGACSKVKEEKAQSDANLASGQTQQPEAAPPPATQTPTTEPAPAPERPRRETRREPRQETPPPAAEQQPTVHEYTVAAGQAVPVTISQELTTKTDVKGSQVTAKTTQPLIVDGATVIPAGSTVSGLITQSERAPRLGGSAKMTVEFTSVQLANGEVYPIRSEPLQFEGKSSTKGDIEKVVGGAVGGGVLGGVLGGKKGAVKGAAAGTVAGGVWAAATRGSDLYVTPGTEVQMTIAAPVRSPVTTGGRS